MQTKGPRVFPDHDGLRHRATSTRAQTSFPTCASVEKKTSRTLATVGYRSTRRPWKLEQHSGHQKTDLENLEVFCMFFSLQSGRHHACKRVFPCLPEVRGGWSDWSVTRPSHSTSGLEPEVQLASMPNTAGGQERFFFFFTHPELRDGWSFVSIPGISSVATSQTESPKCFLMGAPQHAPDDPAVLVIERIVPCGLSR